MGLFNKAKMNVEKNLKGGGSLPDSIMKVLEHYIQLAKSKSPPELDDLKKLMSLDSYDEARALVFMAGFSDSLRASNIDPNSVLGLPEVGKALNTAFKLTDHDMLNLNIKIMKMMK